MATLLFSSLKWQSCLRLLTSVQSVWPQLFPWEVPAYSTKQRLVFLVSIKVSKDVVFVFSLISLFQLMASPPPPVATRTSKALCGFSGGKGWGKSEDPGLETVD